MLLSQTLEYTNNQPLKCERRIQQPNSTTAIMGNDKRTNCAYHRTIYLELKQQ